MKTVTAAVMAITLLASCDGLNPVAPSLPVTCSLKILAGEGGTIPAGQTSSIDGVYAGGATVNLIARPFPDYNFDRWVSSGGGSFDNTASPRAVFTMPAEAVTVTATFKKIPGRENG